MDWNVASSTTPSRDEQRSAARRRFEEQERDYARWLNGRTETDDQGTWRHPLNREYAIRRRQAGYCRSLDMPPIPAAAQAAATPTSRAGYCRTCGTATADPRHPEPDMPSPFRDRPSMSIADRAWLRHIGNRKVVARIWDRLDASPRSALSAYGSLDDEALIDEDGVPECLVSHWRSIDYRADGSRVVVVPGGYVARDLVALGLSREAVFLDAVDAASVCCAKCSKQTRPTPRPAAPRAPARLPGGVSNTKSVFVREGSRGR